MKSAWRSFNVSVALQRRKHPDFRPFSSARDPRFNGAVALQRRKLVSSEIPKIMSTALQWSRRSAATETTLLPGPPLLVPACFNGAVALQRRKRRTPTHHTPGCRGFNGAVALQRRKRRGRSPSSHRPACFNGAVALQRRKRSPASGCSCSSASLQWSRRSAATETRMKGRGRDMRTGFNGAVALQRRKRWARGVWLRQGTGLQWSRRSAATETTRVSVEPVISDMLQWSRRSAATETLVSEFLAAPLIEASMEPSLCSDGNAKKSTRANLSHHRFNGAVALQRRKRWYRSSSRRR